MAEKHEGFPSDEDIRKKEGTGEMSVREAGHLGGEKGGEKGGNKVRDLIEKGEEMERKEKGEQAA
ncbi:MAG TPA: Em GEA1 (EM1) [Armatimonadota bacterium]|nr:Em GEA1 (EM1) [Armatimonadota bacterium]